MPKERIVHIWNMISNWIMRNPSYTS